MSVPNGNANIFESVLGAAHPEQPASDQQQQQPEQPASSVDTTVAPQTDQAPQQQANQPSSTAPPASEQGFDWSSLNYEGVDGPETLKGYVQGISSKTTSLENELEKFKNQNPFTDPVIQKLNEYAGMAGGDPLEAVRTYLELQATDYTSLDAREKVIRHRMREQGLSRNIVEMLVSEEFDKRTKDFEDPDPEWSYEERSKFEAEKAKFKQQNDLRDAKLQAAATAAERYFAKLKEDTKIPQAHKDRQAQEAQLAQKKDAFLQSLPTLTQGAEIKLGFGEGKDPFAYLLTDQDRAQIQNVLPTVPGVESMSPEQVGSLIEMLALNTPEIRSKLFSSAYKHIESKVTEALHAKLGIGPVNPKGSLPSPGMTDDAAKILGPV